jgi:hypothetical protein
MQASPERGGLRGGKPAGHPLFQRGDVVAALVEKVLSA